MSERVVCFPNKGERKTKMFLRNNSEIVEPGEESYGRSVYTKWRLPDSRATVLYPLVLNTIQT